MGDKTEKSTAAAQRNTGCFETTHPVMVSSLTLVVRYSDQKRVPATPDLFYANLTHHGCSVIWSIGWFEKYFVILTFQALLGFHIVVTLIAASILQKLSVRFSLGRRILSRG